MASAAARRSPDTSVRSLASMATSVPVPMAMPRSDCASAGASLTPSPTTATCLPSAWSARTTSTFSPGSTPAIDAVDADVGRDRVGRLLPVARDHDRREPELVQRRDRVARRGLHRVGHDERAAHLAVPARRTRRCGRRRAPAAPRHCDCPHRHPRTRRGRRARRHRRRSPRRPAGVVDERARRAPAPRRARGHRRRRHARSDAPTRPRPNRPVARTRRCRPPARRRRRPAPCDPR